MKARSAVLFDIGGPIDLERAGEAQADAAIRAVVAERTGSTVSDAAYDAACGQAVRNFAPNAYQAILWTLLGQGAAEAWPAVTGLLSRPLLELRPGIAGLLADLAGRGIPLGLAANQPASVLKLLADAGIAGYFTGLDVSGTTGLRKPDPRVFLQAAASLGVAPEDCIMVGDRIDNDIAPARTLGLATVLLRGGRHADQQPRSWLEVPDAEVRDVPGLAATLYRLLQIV